MGDLFASIEEKEDTMMDDLIMRSTEIDKIQNQLNTLELEMLKSDKIDWTQKQQIEETLNNIKKETEALKNIAESMEAINQAINKHDLFSEDLMKKFTDLQELVNEILDTKYRNFCVPLDKFLIRETLPIIKNCNLSICNDSSFSHLSAALGVKTITLMADTPLIYGNYSSNMFPILPDGEETVSHNTLGKEKINSEKIFNKLIEITN